MEDHERPSKLRKLSHGTDTNYVKSTDADQRSNTSAITWTAQNAEVTSTANENSNLEIEIENDEAPPKQLPGGDASLQSRHEVDDHGAEIAHLPLSKNQRKKLKRRAEWEAGREDRKVKRKEKAKEKKARKRAEREEPEAEQHRPRRRQLLPIAFVIDCSFDNLMHERESISLGSQLTRAYSDNSKAPFQAHLYVSSWTQHSELRKRFEGLLKGMYKNWKGIKFVEDDFVGASALAEAAMKDKWGGKIAGAFEKYESLRLNINGETTQKLQQDSEKEGNMSSTVDEQPQSAAAVTGYADRSAQDFAQRNDKKTSESTNAQALMDASEIIYLTSDSPYTLTDLKPYHTYIVGGIVDKNRHKGICYKTALDANLRPQTKELLSDREIQTAKLPIGEYMSMSSRQVLATNHVVEIMLRWLEHGDWGRAFAEVMPKRKGAKLKENGQDGIADDEREGEEFAKEATGEDAGNEDGSSDENDEGTETRLKTYATLSRHDRSDGDSAEEEL